MVKNYVFKFPQPKDIQFTVRGGKKPENIHIYEAEMSKKFDCLTVWVLEITFLLIYWLIIQLIIAVMLQNLTINLTFLW